MTEHRLNNVMVTGGAGYIGSHTCKELALHGMNPITFDNLSTGHRGFVRWGPLVQGDMSSTGEIARTLSEYRIDAVLHFAASAYVGDSILDPAGYFENNVVRTKRLLDGMVEAGVNKLVLSSSCAVYGSVTKIPVSESSPLSPISPYGRTKLICEQMISDYTRAYGLRCIALRYFNAAGADSSGEIGEWHDPETHLIPNILIAALNQTRHPLRIFGSDFDTPDGTAIRDYVHVSDLAAGHVSALPLLLGEVGFLPLNLGTGTGHSILEIISAAEEITNRKINFQFDERRPGDPAILVADYKKAHKYLSWYPKRSSIQNILETAYNWHANPGKNIQC